MILSGEMIKEQILTGNWTCNVDINTVKINPNSIDLRLGNVMLKRKSGVSVLGDNYKSPKYKNCIMKLRDGDWVFKIKPNDFYLGVSHIKINATNPIIINGKPEYFAPMTETRSTVARDGIISNLTAGFCNYGFKDFLTLEIKNLTNNVIYLQPGIRICHLFFQQVYNKNEQPEVYRGNYCFNGEIDAAPIISSGNYK